MSQRTIQTCLDCGRHTIWEGGSQPCRCYTCLQRRDEAKREARFAGAHGSAAPCVKRIGSGPDGKAFVIYLTDGTKITVGRDKSTNGPAWLEISETPIIIAQQNIGLSVRNDGI